MQTKLSHVVSIQTGLFAKTMVEGDIVYLQSKHFDENGLLKAALKPDLKADSVTEKHLLKAGDVLFSSKGSKNFAAVYQSKNVPAVASTSFFVIRMQDKFKNEILPEYLGWAINHPTSQRILKGNAIGTSMVSISKAVLGDLEIFIPGIERQKAILKISELYKKEKKIRQQIDSLRELQIQHQIINSIK